MAREDFSDVTVVVADDNPHLCEAIRTTLDEEGLSNVETCSTPGELLLAVEDNFVDLIILDHLMAGPYPAELIQGIRRNALGHNPFAAIVATVDKDARGSARAMEESGVDKVVPKPVTVDVLFDRISKLARNRDSFIVTPRYIGPNRRRGLRPHEKPAITLDTPNTLRSRMIDREDADVVERMVSDATRQLSGDRFTAMADEIGNLVAAVVKHYDAFGPEDDHRARLRRLIEVSETWRAQKDDSHAEVIYDLAGMVIGLARRILDAPITERVLEVDLLIQVSQAVRAATAIDSRGARTFEEISKLISRFTKDLGR